jgi:CBS domain-containing protein
MATVSELLARKGNTVHTIGKRSTVFEAISLMVAHNVGALVVVEGTSACGIITERDYLRKVALMNRASRSTFVQEIMSDRLLHVDPNTSVDDCMQHMTQARIRHLPVLSSGQLVGMLSIGDLVKFLAEERKQEIHQLTAYIQGAYS